MKKYHVKKGDKVAVISGSYKGGEAVVAAIISKNDRAVLEFTDKKERKLGKRTIRKSQANPQGGMVDRAVSVHVSNLKLVEAAAPKAKAAGKAEKAE